MYPEVSHNFAQILPSTGNYSVEVTISSKKDQIRSPIGAAYQQNRILLERSRNAMNGYILSGAHSRKIVEQSTKTKRKPCAIKERDSKKNEERDANRWDKGKTFLWG